MMSLYLRRATFFLGALCLGKDIEAAFTGIGDQGPCPLLESNTTATFDDFAGSSPYFVKYYASNNDATYPAYTSKDGHKITLTRIGTSNDYTFKMTSFDTEKNKTEINTIYTVDATNQRVKKYGVWQNYQIMSFKKDSYALVYFCIPREDGHELYRALMTTTLSNNLTVPLQEDRKHNFKHPLYELPYCYILLY